MSDDLLQPDDASGDSAAEANEALPPWSPAAIALLSDEKARPIPDNGKERVFERLGRSFAGSAAAPMTAAPTGLSRLVWPLLGTLAVGLTAGFWAGQAWEHEKVPLRSPDAQPPAAMTVSSPVSTEAVSIVSDSAHALPLATASAGGRHPATMSSALAPAPMPSASTGTPSAPSSGSPSDDALSRERSLLDRGTLALRRGNPTDALAAVAEQRALFPTGQFAEERDALEVHALRQAGKVWEASSAESAFHKRYPSSTLVPTGH